MPYRSTHQYLVAGEAEPPWGIPAAVVKRLIAASDWSGVPPLRIPGRLPNAPARLLVIDTPQGERAILVSGSVAIRTVEVEQICELPAPCRSVRAGIPFTALAVQENEVLFLIVDWEWDFDCDSEWKASPPFTPPEM